MKIAFRVDASTLIGTGHVMRCLTLANTLRKNGVFSHFLCRNHPGNMAGKIESEGHEFTLLSNKSLNPEKQPDNGDSVKHSLWLGASWQDDAAETISALKNESAACLVVDHYGIDIKWECEVRNALSIKIMVIDGLADRIHDCDILLDQTYSPEGAGRWKRLVPATCKLFIGPQYALLRPEFYRARQMLRMRDGTIRRVLIAFGGVDMDNATGLVLESVLSLKPKNVTWDIVLGRGNPHIAAIEKRCKSLSNVELHIQPDNIADIMLAADLSIGAGGTMMWERCCVALPSILISIADNQIKPSQYLDSINAAYYIGSIYDKHIGYRIAEKLSFLFKNPDKIKQLSINSLKVLNIETNIIEEVYSLIIQSEAE